MTNDRLAEIRGRLAQGSDMEWLAFYSADVGYLLDRLAETEAELASYRKAEYKLTNELATERRALEACCDELADIARVSQTGDTTHDPEYWRARAREWNPGTLRLNNQKLLFVRWNQCT